MPFPTKSSICPGCAPIRWRRGQARRGWSISRGRSSRAATSRRGSIPCRRSSARDDLTPRRAAISDAQAARRAASSGAWARTSSRPASSPVLIDLMARGFVSALAMNGAGIIHDFEIALVGRDLRRRRRRARSWPLRHGRRDRRAAERGDRDGVRRGLGLGQAVGALPGARNPPHADRSLAVAAAPTRHSGDRARGHRHRHHPHASRGLGRGASARQPSRLPLLRRRRGAAGAAAST